MDPTTHCPIDGTPFDPEGVCSHGHTRSSDNPQKPSLDTTHCSIDGTPFDEDDFCAYKHKRP
jgi:predicted nucleic acid-binding Zn ribbon protein